MNLQDLLRTAPNIHSDSSGVPASWQLEDSVLSFIDDAISSTSRTLETGAGISTILFAIKHSEHLCIVPDHLQAERIRDYCHQREIRTDKLNFVFRESELALPQIAVDGLDLVLIDGRHAFPTPFIDWYYMASKLKIGGIVVIDDTHLWTGHVLKEFLIYEPEWKLQRDFPRSTTFVKLKEGSHQKEWMQQPYLVRESAIGIRKEQLRFLIKLLRNGEFPTLMRHVLKRPESPTHASP